MDDLTVLPDQSEILHYDDPSFPLYLRRNWLGLYPFKTVLCHWHQEMEFFLVEKGHPSYFVNGTTIPLKEGECLFVNSKIPHYGFSPDGADSTYLVLVFNPSLLAANPLIEENFINPLKNDAETPFLVFDAAKTNELRKEMLFIKDTVDAKALGYQLTVLSHLYAFWNDFLALKGQEKINKLAPSAKTLLLQRMLTYIYGHYKEKITLKDIAQSASLSDGYAIHLFSSLLHASPISYLLSYRVEKAEELLHDFTKDVGEVAEEVGFDNPSYFSEMFKREKGYSPRDYRNILLKEKI
jgi:AraC-like DNA-binding protein